MLLHGLRIIYGSGIRTGVLLKLRVPYIEISISVGTEYKIQYTNKNISFQVSTKTNVARQKVAHVLDTAIRPIHDLPQYLKKQNTVKCYLGTFGGHAQQTCECHPNDCARAANRNRKGYTCNVP